LSREFKVDGSNHKIRLVACSIESL